MSTKALNLDQEQEDHLLVSMMAFSTSQRVKGRQMPRPKVRVRVENQDTECIHLRVDLPDPLVWVRTARAQVVSLQIEVVPEDQGDRGQVDKDKVDKDKVDKVECEVDPQQEAVDHKEGEAEDRVVTGFLPKRKIHCKSSIKRLGRVHHCLRHYR